LRFPILLLSAATLALGACDSGQNSAANSPAAQADPGAEVSDKDLEERVMAALGEAPKHGLTKDLFLKGELPAEGPARRQALVSALGDYASALAHGKVDPTKVREVYTVPRPKADIGAGLKQALVDNKLAEWLDSLVPQTDEYRALSNAFVQLVKRSPNLPDVSIPTGDVLKPGASDPRIPAIAANLRMQGYLAEPEEQERAQAKPESRYTPELVAAVKRWQADSGLKVDGVIGNDTVAALNSSPRDRARTLAVAMERLRWLDRNPPSTRIDVNTAGTYLDYFRDGQRVDHRRVVVGQPGWETPQLGSPIFQLVANPTWTVPESIEKEELAAKGAAYLASQNIVRKNGRLVQEPGPKNSLGQVKFDMKNDEAIYLHDTPAKALFGQEERHESHGCVRVQDAVGFARAIAQADGVLDKFNEALATGDETFVDLNKEIPVRLMYHTAYLGEDGRIHFAADVYGWDNDVATALGYESRQPTKVKTRGGDIGP
jgi:murein L,D-transpeptidase YcbB/YkuD